MLSEISPVFTPSFFSTEMRRLFKLFVPHESLPDVNILVDVSSPDGFAAKAVFDTSSVVMYLDYCECFPQDYKMTLLHEAGHFVYSKDHSAFSDYFDYLTFRQKFINEVVIPSTYEEFLYCNSRVNLKYKFVCSSCRSSTDRVSSNPVGCSSCGTNMLLVGGL
jgi:hypothetical protein